MRPQVSVIVPLEGSGADALPCLEALERHAPPVPFELVLVADGHAAAELLACLEGQVQVADAPQPYTVLAAFGAGAERAAGELLLFLDPSVLVGPGWFEPLAAALADPGVAAAQPRIVGAAGRLADAGGLALAGGELVAYGAGHEFPGAPAFACTRAPDTVTTTCLLVRAEALRQAGGLPREYATRPYGEADLSFALKAEGWALIYEPRSQVTTTTPTTTDVPGPACSDRTVLSERWAGQGYGPECPDPAARDRWAHRPPAADGQGLSVLFIESGEPPAPESRLDMIRRVRAEGHFVAVHLLGGAGPRGWTETLATLGVPQYGVAQYGVPQYGVTGGVAPRDPVAAARWRRAHAATLASLLVRFPFDTVVFGNGPAAAHALPHIRAFLPDATVVIDSTAADPSEFGAPGWASTATILGQADRVACAPAVAAGLRRQLPGSDVVEIPEPPATEAGESAVRQAIGRMLAPAPPAEPRVPAFDRDRPCRPDLVSIVIPVWNRLDLTRPCVESLRRYSREPFEIIIVDNGSTDGTAEWLARQPDLVVISNPENRGFAAACNQGMAVARGEWVVLLNNDTKVPRRWLDGLLGAFSAPDVGAVGPRSNSVSGPQVVDSARYRTTSEYVRFAEDWRRAHRGATWETSRLVGFCLALSRSALDAVGGLDEAFGPGNFEDDDLCLRLRAAGWRLLVADEVLIHHEGHASFGTAFFGAMGTGLRHFQRKYGALDRSGDTPPSLSACLIVKDEEEMLPDCLVSLRGLVDEVVVVDTGSTDATREIARAAGCRVLDAPWNDDFAEARNVSLDAARGEWALVIDADERAVCQDRGALRALLAQTEIDVMHLANRAELGETDGEGTASHLVTRLFVRSKFRFEGRLHEQVARLAGGPLGGVSGGPLWLRHEGYRPAVIAERGKQARNDRIARAEYQAEASPDASSPWRSAYNAARSTLDTEERIRLFTEALGHMTGAELEFRMAALGALGRAQLDAGLADDALAAGREALALLPGDEHALYLIGRALNHLGRHAEAIEPLRSLVEADGPRPGALVSNSSYRETGGPTELGLAYAGLGDWAAAAPFLRSVAERSPGTFPAWPELIAAVRASNALGWAEEIATVAEGAPKKLLAAAANLAGPDRLLLLDHLTAHRLAVSTAAFAALEVITTLEDPALAASERDKWLDRLDAEPTALRVGLAQRLEVRAPAAALWLWHRLGDLPAAALGRARCHVALGSAGEAMDALRSVDLDRLAPSDALFAATLALGVGAPGLAGSILDTIPTRPQGVPVEALLQVAEIIGPDCLDRARRRFATSAA